MQPANQLPQKLPTPQQFSGKAPLPQQMAMNQPLQTPELNYQPSGNKQQFGREEQVWSKISSNQTSNTRLYEEKVEQFQPQNQTQPLQSYQDQYFQQEQLQLMKNMQLMDSMPSSQPSYQALNSSNQQMIFQQNPKADQKQKQQEYLIQLQNEIKEKEEKKRKEKEEKIRKEQEELKKNMQYNPFGRGGAGAPIKDNSGNVVTIRKNGQSDNIPMNQQRMVQPQPQQNYQQQFLPQSNFQPPQNVYSHQQQMLPYQDTNPQITPINYPQNHMQQFNNIQPPEMMNPMGMQFNAMGNNQAPQAQYGGFQQPPTMNMQAPPQYMFSPVEQQMYPQQQVPNMINQTPPIPNQKQQLQENIQKGEGLNIGVFNDSQNIRQKAQKQELNDILRIQMEEQKRRKEEEQRKKKEEEWKEEQRILKERQQIELEYKKEEEKKKAKQQEFQKANADIIIQKNQKKKLIEIDEGPLNNYVVSKQGQKPDIFGNQIQTPLVLNQSVEEEQLVPVEAKHTFKRQTTFEGGQPHPQISQTRIINDISNELKSNFKEEIGKLREDMNSQQRAFREQLERLKIETVQNVASKKDAMDEIEKIKQELQMQRQAERMQELKLQNALEKHNPNKQISPFELLQNYDKPGAFSNQGNNNNPPLGPPSFNVGGYQNQNMNGSFYNAKRTTGSRQESRESQRKREINNYEKMFFNNNSNNNSLNNKPKSFSQQREEPKKSVPQYNIKEEKMVNFANDYLIQEPDYSYKKDNAYGGYEPKIMKRGESNINNSTLKGESLLLPIGHADEQDIFSQALNNKSKPDFNAQKQPIYQYQFDNQESQMGQNKQGSSKQDMSYLEHLKGIGSKINLTTESGENTMDFIERVVNGKDDLPKKQSSKQLDNRLADKLDGLNIEFPEIPVYEGIQTEYLKNLSQKQVVPSLVENKYNSEQHFKRQDSYQKFVNQGGMNLNSSPGEGTMNSFGTLNSVNLDKLNERNEVRLAMFNEYTNDNGTPYSKGNNNGPVDSNDELKQLDNLLFDILRSKDTAPQSSNSGPNKIVHINKMNNAENINKMRETRDQFMAPKMQLIDEDNGEDFDGTFKDYNKNMNDAFKMPSNIQRYDSLLDNTNLTLY